MRSIVLQFFVALKSFFTSNDIRNDILGYLLKSLHYILGWMEDQQTYKFFSSTLLIVYEESGCHPVCDHSDRVDVRLIDFERVQRQDEEDKNDIDSNTIFGIKNFIAFLEKLKH